MHTDYTKRTTHVCKLGKSLYGLKQAPRAWYITLSKAFEQIGAKPLKSEPGVFVYDHDGSTCYCLVYVDDILLMSSHQHLIDNVKTQLKSEFKIKELGKPTQFLGVRIHESEQGKGYMLRQEHYVDEVLEKFNMTQAKPMSTPAVPVTKRKSLERQSDLPYMELGGCLMYIAMRTRPDISFAVGQLSRKMSNYDETDWIAAKRVLRYLKGTKAYSLVLGAGISHDEPTLRAYSDADYAGDVMDRKSTTGYVVYLGDALIGWASRKQSLVTLSTTQAETVALSQTAQQVVWLREVLNELNMGCNKPTTIYCDNQAALLWAESNEHRKSKMLEVRYHYTREKVSAGVVHIQYLPTADMTADLFTKPLSTLKFEKHVRSLGLRDESQEGVSEVVM